MEPVFYNKKEPKEGYEILVSKKNTLLKDLEIARLRLGKKILPIRVIQKMKNYL